MFRTFMRVPLEASFPLFRMGCDGILLTLYQILAETPSERRPRPSPCRSLEDLPGAILDLVFDRLEILDRSCLALCSKFLLKRAAEHEHLTYLLHQPPSAERLRNFFEERLSGTWLQGRLKYCTDCGRYQSTSGAHWRDISEKYTRERSGRIPGLWKSRREDGWLRYWIERWAETDIKEPDAGALLLMREDPTTIVCPRCSVQNVECNAWRLNRTRQPR
jgi:hypothetical protein